MSNADPIAEARRNTGGSRDDFARGSAQWEIHRLCDALEAQPAPLVADSIEALAKAQHDYVRSLRPESHGPFAEWHELDDEYRGYLMKIAEAGFASGVVSLAGDRDRATAKRAWDEGMKAALLEDGGDVGPVNPYREGEARNDWPPPLDTEPSAFYNTEKEPRNEQ